MHVEGLGRRVVAHPNASPGTNERSGAPGHTPVFGVRSSGRADAHITARLSAERQRLTVAKAPLVVAVGDGRCRVHGPVRSSSVSFPTDHPPTFPGVCRTTRVPVSGTIPHVIATVDGHPCPL